MINRDKKIDNYAFSERS